MVQGQGRRTIGEDLASQTVATRAFETTPLSSSAGSRSADLSRPRALGESLGLTVAQSHIRLVGAPQSNHTGANRGLDGLGC
jgi:hypothetical protein